MCKCVCLLSVSPKFPLYDPDLSIVTASRPLSVHVFVCVCVCVCVSVCLSACLSVYVFIHPNLPTSPRCCTHTLQQHPHTLPSHFTCTHPRHPHFTHPHSLTAPTYFTHSLCESLLNLLCVCVHGVCVCVHACGVCVF